MKKIRYLLLAATMLFAIGSCKKGGAGSNPLNDVSNLKVGAYLLLDSTLNVNLDYSNFSISTVGIKASQFPNGQAIKSIVLYVSTKSSYDTTTWSKVKTIPYTGPKTAITCNGQELSTALNIPVTGFSPGTNYSFYTRVITTSGATFDASNTGNNTGSGLVTGSTYKSAFNFTAYIVCPFTGHMAGSYKVIRDDWQDWSPGNIVQITDGPGTNVINLSQVYPNGGTVVNPLLVTVDPASGTASIPTVNFGNYGGGYNEVAVGAGTNNVAGYVFSCTGYITLKMHLTATGPGGNGVDSGPNTLILQRVSND